jgi:YD repeat-containing protein
MVDLLLTDADADESVTRWTYDSLGQVKQVTQQAVVSSGSNQVASKRVDLT